MSKISRFEDFECWQVSRVLNQDIFSLVKKLEEKRNFQLINQMTSASLSIMNNIAEGFGSHSKAEFQRFLLYSRRSCSEVQSCLYVALDQEYIDSCEFQNLYESTGRVRKIIYGLIRYLKKK
jgi:four helix bundle protein